MDLFKIYSTSTENCPWLCFCAILLTQI